MAEIEFKRRGTPLWAVVLVLLVIAGALYALFGRGGDPAPATADSTAATPTPAAPGAAAPATPAAPTGPLATLSAWVDTAKVGTGAAPVAAYAGTGLRLLADAVQEKAPMAGIQYMMIRAMADTVLMPDTPARKQLDATQAAFFAAQFALRDKPGAARIETAAQKLQLNVPLAQQRADVENFFKVSRDVLRDPSKPPAGGPAPGTAPAPAAKS